ncbi:unnamed protein product [Amaranthus hypochondriacus]
MANKFKPSHVNTMIQKLGTILGLLKALLLIESDSCILQLVKTCSSTLLVDNIQLLQSKAMSLTSAICYLYTQLKSYVFGEVIQLLWKLPFSKRVARAFHLSDEEQKKFLIFLKL